MLGSKEVDNQYEICWIMNWYAHQHLMDDKVMVWWFDGDIRWLSGVSGDGTWETEHAYNVLIGWLKRTSAAKHCKYLKAVKGSTY